MPPLNAIWQVENVFVHVFLWPCLTGRSWCRQIKFAKLLGCLCSAKDNISYSLTPWTHWWWWLVTVLRMTALHVFWVLYSIKHKLSCTTLLQVYLNHSKTLYTYPDRLHRRIKQSTSLVCLSLFLWQRWICLGGHLSRLCRPLPVMLCGNQQ